MLGVGWTEMLVIGVVALIVIGPKELPGLMHKIGRFAGTVRRMGADFQRELNRTTGLDEVKNLRNAITQPLKATTDSIRREFNTTTPSGEVKPSGALKPADPKAESVVNEIHTAAGMKPAEPAKAAEAPKPASTGPVKAAAASAGATTITAIAPSSAAPPPVKPELVPEAKPKRSRKKQADTGPVTITELAMPPQTPPASKPVRTRRAAAPKRVESPAPAEALAPAKQPAKPKRKRAAKKAT